MNRVAKIYIAGVSFLNFPAAIFKITYAIIPRRIPFAIEYVYGIITKQIKAGMDSEKSSKGISFTELIISRPTIIRAGAVAAEGIERNRGEKKSATANPQATTNAVNPERPP